MGNSSLCSFITWHQVHQLRFAVAATPALVSEVDGLGAPEVDIWSSEAEVALGC